MGNTQSKVQEDDVHWKKSDGTTVQHCELEDCRGNKRKQKKKGIYMTKRSKERLMDADFRLEYIRLEILARRKNYWSFLNE